MSQIKRCGCSASRYSSSTSQLRRQGESPKSRSGRTVVLSSPTRFEPMGIDMGDDGEDTWDNYSQSPPFQNIPPMWQEEVRNFYEGAQMGEMEDPPLPNESSLIELPPPMNEPVTEWPNPDVKLYFPLFIGSKDEPFYSVQEYSKMEAPSFDKSDLDYFATAFYTGNFDDEESLDLINALLVDYTNAGKPGGSFENYVTNRIGNYNDLIEGRLNRNAASLIDLGKNFTYYKTVDGLYVQQ